MLFQVGVEVDGVINTTFLTFEGRQYGIKAAIVPISRRQDTLGCTGVAPVTKGCDKGSQVTVGFTQRDTMVAVPGIRD